jgi:DNA-directed RNA polymerase specialized sigma24 family protein
MTDIDPIELEQLQRAFDRLPDLHAAVFSAARHDDMTYAEIAAQIGITPLHVERIIADTLHRLHLDIADQQRGIARGPIRRFIRRCRLDLRLLVRVWRDRL